MALDAVVEPDDEQLFNAGRGGVFTSMGQQELEAAVMNGRDRRGGNVKGIFR